MKKTILLLLLALSCYIYSSETALLISKEKNMYKIDGGVYRSQQLESEDLSIINELGIKTIINLRFFNRDKDKKIFKETDLILINNPLKTWNITPKEVAQILYDIEKSKENGAVLFHCYHGSDRTGLISGMYRIIYQDYEIDEALLELVQGSYGFHKIWSNIPKMFNENTVTEIKNEIFNLKNQQLKILD
ncbi:tyrosine-protein phosphatase [Streptobacillus moniliformis]|uniref:tyrosine-protein phosphatase n=1 Tax=Streptobacillus moniliformis TaxID=34105 RepID=UPI0007E3B63F|nr:tyrosine-protein phosphatase [Streptobacillus moniliformis]QXW65454.1 tyrosine-protein phosphatase [Streptobacillus moniliformis]